MRDYLYAVFFLGSLCPDPGSLNHPDWRTRDATERALRLTWPLRLGELSELAHTSESAEVRARAARLLAPWHAWCAELRAAAVLSDPLPVNAAAFWHDVELRERVYRMAIRAKCPEWVARDLLPDENESWWRWTMPTHTRAAWALARVKCHLELQWGWPFCPE